MKRDANDIMREEGVDALRQAIDDAPAENIEPPRPDKDNTGDARRNKAASADPAEDAEVERERRDIAHRLVTATALAYDPEPQRDYLVEGVIPADNLTLVSGRGGIGKSRLMTQLAVAMQTDGHWLNMPVKQGPALFVTSEEDRRDVHLALLAILKAEGKNLPDCSNLHILPLADRDACMAAAPSKLAPLEATPLWRALEETVERIEPKALFLDALADMFGGEENFRRHVRGFIVLLKRLALRRKLAVLLISHPSVSGMNSGSGLSGSTDWHNGPRARLFIQELNDDEGVPLDKSKRAVTIMKAQHSDMEGTIFHVRWDNGVYVYEGQDGGPAPYDRAIATTRAESVFLGMLRDYEAQGRAVSPNPGLSYAPAVFAKDPDAKGVTKTALARAMSKLLKDNDIHIETEGPPSKRRAHLKTGPNLNDEMDHLGTETAENDLPNPSPTPPKGPTHWTSPFRQQQTTDSGREDVRAQPAHASLQARQEEALARARAEIERRRAIARKADEKRL